MLGFVSVAFMYYSCIVTYGILQLHGVDTNLPLTDHVMKNIEHMSSQRLRHLPVQYVIGEWDFHSLTLGMKSPVFIPRPETEVSA